MMDIIRFFRHEPALGGLVIFCLLLVGGVVISDWREKRRNRQLLRLRAELKKQNSAGNQVIKGESLSRSTPERSGFRIFRWEFVVLSVVCVAIWMPFSKNISLPIQAISRNSETLSGAQKQQPQAESTEISPPTITEPIISLVLSSAKVTPGKVRLHLPDSDNSTSESMVPRFHSSLLTGLRKTATERPANLNALFEENPKAEEISALEQTATLSARDFYPIGDGGFTPNDPRKPMRFTKR